MANFCEKLGTNDSATIKCTFKNKKGVSKNVTLKVNVKAVEAAFSVAETEVDLLVKDTKALTVTGDATFKSSDEKIVTVDEKGVVTAVAAGKATVTVTSKKDETKTATVTISVKRTLLESVTQKKFDTVVATIKGDTASLVNKDVVIKNSVGRVILTKSIAVDANDKTQVTIVVFENMSDGKEYTMTIDDTTVPFTVTDGKVASVGIDKTVVACDKDVEIKVQAKDASGVLVYEAGFAEVDASHYTATITSTLSTFTKNGSKIRLVKAGDTATAKVTWVSGTYDEKGQPKEKIESGDITITAGEPAAVDNFSMKIKTTSTPATENFGKITANSQVKITDTANAFAFFQFKDVDGTEVVRYADYTLESTNNAVITLVGAFGANKYVQVVPGSIGTAYILVKKNNVVVTSFEITVVAGSDINSLALDKTEIVMSNTVEAAEKQTVKATIKDQYGQDYTPAGNMTVSLVNVASAQSGVSAAQIIADVNNAANVNKYFTAGSKQVEFYASTNSAINYAGTYTYELSYKDAKGVKWAQIVKVELKAPATAGTVNDTVAIEIDKASADLAVSQWNKADITVTVGVALSRNGVKVGTIDPAGSIKKIETVNNLSDVTAAAIEYAVKKDGATVLTYSTSTGAINKTPNLAMANIDVTASAGTFTMKVRKDNSDAIEKLAAGTYTVEATILTENGGVAKNPIIPNATSFVITDSQATGTVTLANATVKSNVATDLKTLVANALQYSGYDYNIGANVAAGQTAFISTGSAMTTTDKSVKINYIEGTSNIAGKTAITAANYNGAETVVAGTTVTVNKINLSVAVPGSGKYVTFTIDLTKDANGVAQPGINFSVVQA